MLECDISLSHQDQIILLSFLFCILAFSFVFVFFSFNLIILGLKAHDFEFLGCQPSWDAWILAYALCPFSY